MALPQTAGQGATAAVTPQNVWDALISTGASSVQAAGIMGNWIHESSLNPESVNPSDSNGFASYGLAQWNAGSYPNASTLVTGNPTADLAAQVRYFAQTGGLAAAQGTTPQQVASSVASSYERCQGCNPGGTQNTEREASAGVVAGWAASGSWPQSAGQATNTAVLTSAQLAAESQQTQQALSECLWGINWGNFLGQSAWGFLLSPGGFIAEHLFGGGGGSSGIICLFRKSQARALLGGALIGAGGTTIALGAALVIETAGFTPAGALMKAAVPAAMALRAVGAPAPGRAGGVTRGRASARSATAAPTAARSGQNRPAAPAGQRSSSTSSATSSQQTPATRSATTRASAASSGTPTRTTTPRRTPSGATASSRHRARPQRRPATKRPSGGGP